MNKSALGCGLGALLSTISIQGLAVETPTWNYMSLEVVASGDGEVDTFSERIEGYRLDVAKSLGDFMFVRAASNAYHVDNSGINIDVSPQQFGAGGHYPISAGAITFDLWGGLNYERIAFEGIVGTGPGVDVGVRAMFSPAFELGIAGKVLGDISFDTVDADYTGYLVSADYTVVPGFDIQGSFSNYELDIDGAFTFDYKNIFGIGVRLTY